MARSSSNNRCARRGPLSSAARRRLPDAGFALPKARKYPIYKLGRDGELIPSGTHAALAKARARQAYDRGSMTWGTFQTIVRKANKVLSRCSRASKRARARGLSQGRSSALTVAEKNAQMRRLVNAAIKEIVGC